MHIGTAEESTLNKNLMNEPSTAFVLSCPQVRRLLHFIVVVVAVLHCIRDNKIRDQYLWIYYCGVLLEQRKIWMSWKHTHLTSWTQESASWGGAIKPILIWFVEEWDFSNFLARSSQKYFMGPIECEEKAGPCVWDLAPRRRPRSCCSGACQNRQKI